MSGFTTTQTLAQVLNKGNSTGDVDIDFEGTNGSLITIKQATQLVATAAGASVTATGIFPAGVIRLGGTIRVTTTITGPTDIDVGVTGDTNMFGGTLALIAGTTTSRADFTANPTGSWSAAAGDIIITANGGNFTGGQVRVVAYYLDITGPTS